MIDRQELRFQILKLLLGSAGYTSNQHLLAEALKGGGIVATRDMVRTEMAWLDNVGAIINRDTGGVFVATLADEGEEHLRGARVIPDIRKPRPGEVG